MEVSTVDSRPSAALAWAAWPSGVAASAPAWSGRPAGAAARAPGDAEARAPGDAVARAPDHPWLAAWEVKNGRRLAVFAYGREGGTTRSCAVWKEERRDGAMNRHG
jgi:hypothetical protein